MEENKSYYTKTTELRFYNGILEQKIIWDNGAEEWIAIPVILENLGETKNKYSNDYPLAD